MVSASENRAKAAVQKEEARIDLILKLKQDKDRGYSNSAIAQKHELSESTVRELLNLDVYMISVTQLGTNKKTTVDVVAPMGTPYKDVVAKLKG